MFTSLTMADTLSGMTYAIHSPWLTVLFVGLMGVTAFATVAAIIPLTAVATALFSLRLESRRTSPELSFDSACPSDGFTPET